MTKKQALDFLRSHQPMPNLDELSEDEFQGVMKEWAQACEYFTKHPNLDSIPLFLGSFGEGDDAEVYQLFQDVVQATVELDVDAVARHMIDALSPSSPLPTRVHAAEVCGDVLSKDPTFHETLLSIIENDDEDEDVRSFCAAAFSIIGQEECFDVDAYRNRVEAVLQEEDDEDISMFLSDLLGDDYDEDDYDEDGCDEDGDYDEDDDYDEEETSNKDKKSKKK